MTDTTLFAQFVADFLRDNPNFFTEHGGIFASLHIPNPHGTRAISLSERQILTLRERNRVLEWQLSELARNASSNENIGARVSQWCCRLLAETDTQALPDAIVQGLAEQFKLEHVGLRLWNLSHQPESGYGEAVSPDVRTFADSLKTPYCGNDSNFEAVSWLSSKPQSLALIALRLHDDGPSVGLLVLGWDDAQRFAPDNGTEFLQSIGKIASACLHRLHHTSDDDA
jgi:uncharacterized protein